MMPKKATHARSHQLAALQEVIHDRKIDKKIPHLIEKIYSCGKLSDVEIANLNEISRVYNNTSKIPKSLSVELVKTTTLAQDLWSNAKESNEIKELMTALKKIIYLKRCEADCLREIDQERYEALLQQFEPGQNNKALKYTLSSLREPLKELREKILSKKKEYKKITGEFDKVLQMNISKEIAKSLCFDFNSGRLDESLHPFCSGHRTDARITTRVDVNNPLSCISSVMHEVGHALYEQGIPKKLYNQPVGSWCSMAFHESQSRLIENQIGRSKAFCEFLFPMLKQYFPHLNLCTPNELYFTTNEVKLDYIRTESDEVNYNIHILLRYELEEELISGTLEVDDLEKEWNARFYRDFEMIIDVPNQGFLQDIHWFSGLFGYFPTYTLGNLYAANIYNKLKEDINDLEKNITSGQFSQILKWLHRKIHSKGRIFTPVELIKSATDKPASTSIFLEYLTRKFGEIYDI